MGAGRVVERFILASLDQDLVRKMQQLLRSFDYAEAHSLAVWFKSSFPIVFGSRTPKGMKRLKQDAEWLHRYLENVRPPVDGDAPEYREHARQELSKRWAYVSDQVGDLVSYFSNVGRAPDQEVPVEVTVGGVTYLNGIGFPKKKLMKWATELNKLWSSVKGWRKKAVTAAGGLKVELARPQKFRGSVSGKYRSRDDVLMLRATPAILKRAGGSYGAPDYIMVHELGHRYEYKVGTGRSFDMEGWYTTRYSLKEGEAFAELFALGHFGTSISGTGPVLDLAGKLERFEVVMKGGRVASRYRQATEEFEQDEGDFWFVYAPQHVKMADSIIRATHQAIKMCRAKGLPIKKKFFVEVSGRKVSHALAGYFPTNPPLLRVAPKAFRDPKLVNTLIHELAHYIHDKEVPGGMGNSAINGKYTWAMGQKSTGAGNRIDDLTRRIKGVKSEIKSLEKERVSRPKAPRKGQTFQLRIRHPFGSTMYNLTGRLLNRSRGMAEVELLDAPKDVKPWWIGPKSSNGLPVIKEELKYLLPATVNPAVDARIQDLEGELSQLFTDLDQAGQDDRYEAQQHEWVPTTYARKNSLEWFAELCTTMVLGHLAAPVESWLKTVIKNGKSV